MDRGLLIASLSGSWDDTRAARDALVERGTAVVEAVVDLLLAEPCPVDRTVPANVLCRIGEPALRPLADAVAAADSPELSGGAEWALGRLEVSDHAAYVPLLDHADPRVRGSALYAFQNLGEAALRFAGRLIPLLGDPDPGVRQRAVWAFGAIGDGAVPELRRLRREPAAGPRIRAGALEALAALGGPSALDDRDRSALRRLTRIKQPAEVPYGLHLCGGRYAVRSTDQNAVLDAFGLSDPEPVTLRTGEAAWAQDQRWDAGLRRHLRSRSPHPEGGCRFGAAQWYGLSDGDDWTAW